MIGLLAVSSPPGSRAAPTRSELDAARARLMALERDFELVVERYNLAAERLMALQTRIGAAELVVRRIEGRMRSTRTAAVELAREIYKRGSTTSVEAVLSSRSLADMETRITYLRSTEEAQVRVFEELAAGQDTLTARIQRLDEARAAALSTEQRIARLRSDIETKLAEQQGEVDELVAAIERAERLAAARAAAPVFSVTASLPPRPASAPNARAQEAVDAALTQVGTPYQWGASGPGSYDCSGLTMWAWGRAGVILPHNSGAQFNATPRVAPDEWEPGDLLFFGSPIHHVGMFIGNGQMVDAPYTGATVRVTSVARPDYAGAGRPRT